MTTALVTGGAGFIGSHLVRSLLEDGFRVRILDSLVSGSREKLGGLDVEWFVNDVRDVTAVDRAVSGTDQVYHLAAFVSVPASIEDPRTCYDVNVTGSLNVLDAARRSGVGSVVLASSCAVYGDRAGPAREDHEPRPLSPYAASKLAMEQAAAVFHRVYNLQVVSLRFFNVYGPGQPAGSAYAAVIPAFIDALLSGRSAVVHGDGQQTRDFIYVNDVTRACRLAAPLPEAAGRTFNIGSGESRSVLDLAGILQPMAPEHPAPRFGPARPGDLRTSAADTRLAEQALGYRAEIGLELGLQRTVEWTRAERRKTAL